MTTTPSPPDPHAASADRRRRLRQAEDTNTHALKQVSNAVSLDKYYRMTDRLLWAFSSAVDDRRLDDAYVLGLRFATFSMEVLPKHVHYAHANYSRQRQKNATHVQDVVTKLESITRRMDVEELVAAQQEKEQPNKEEPNRNKKLDPPTTNTTTKTVLTEEERDRKHQAILQQQREEHLQTLAAERARQQAIQEAEARQDLEQRARDKLKALQQPKQQQKQALDNHNTIQNGQPTAATTAKRDSSSSTTEDLESRLAQLSSAKTDSATPITNTTNTPKAPASSTSKAAALTALSAAKAATSAVVSKIIPTPSTSPPSSPTKRRSMDAPGDERGAVEIDVHGTPRYIHKPQLSSRTNIATANINSSPPSPPSHLTLQEANTVRLLQETIRVQERRLANMESSDEPSRLRAQAKHKLQHDNDRKGALFCLYKRRKLQQTCELIKHAIFKMETQLLWLESAAQDRNVATILEQAQQEMAALPQASSSLDAIGNDSEYVNSLVDISAGDVLDEEDLLSELLQDEDDDGKKRLTVQADEDDMSILTLPTLPSRQSEPKEKASDSIAASLF